MCFAKNDLKGCTTPQIAAALSRAMLFQAFLQVAGDAGIERAIGGAHDINEPLVRRASLAHHQRINALLVLRRGC